MAFSLKPTPVVSNGAPTSPPQAHACRRDGYRGDTMLGLVAIVHFFHALVLTPRDSRAPSSRSPQVSRGAKGEFSTGSLSSQFRQMSVSTKAAAPVAPMLQHREMTVEGASPLYPKISFIHSQLQILPALCRPPWWWWCVPCVMHAEGVGPRQAGGGAGGSDGHVSWNGGVGVGASFAGRPSSIAGARGSGVWVRVTLTL